MQKNMADTVSKSWFCVLNNPQNYYNYDENNKIDLLIELSNIWVQDSDSRSCAFTLCLSADGLLHVHMVLEDIKSMRFSAVKKVFDKAHIEATKGNKAQALDYINKVGVFEEKGEKVLEKYIYGEIKGCQGRRTDLSRIEEFVKAGMTPLDIFKSDVNYRRYEKIVKDIYYQERLEKTPFKRDLLVEWHFGNSGTGKSNTVHKFIEMFGENDVYFMSDYCAGGLDNYMGQKVLFMDEFRGQIPYSTLLSMLDGYKQQYHSRFRNIYGLWDVVIITTPYPPEILYKNIVGLSDFDCFEQLKRRITTVHYHYRENGIFKEKSVLSSKYRGFGTFNVFEDVHTSTCPF